MAPQPNSAPTPPASHSAWPNARIVDPEPADTRAWFDRAVEGSGRMGSTRRAALVGRLVALRSAQRCGVEDYLRTILDVASSGKAPAPLCHPPAPAFTRRASYGCAQAAPEPPAWHSTDTASVNVPTCTTRIVDSPPTSWAIPS